MRIKIYPIKKHKKLISLLVASLFSLTAIAQSAVSAFFPEIKILESNNPAPGYYFLAAKGISAPGASLYIAIVDNYGTPVFFRKMNKASGSMRLLPDGRIAYMNGVPRKLYILNSMLEVEQIYAIQGFDVNGHDWAYDNNGNFLLMGEAIRYIDMSGLIAGGNINAEVLDLIIQEFDKDGNLKYTWNSADHFDIFDGNENSPYLDYTEAQLDYVHANSVAVDSDTSFIISNRHMDEITKVDRRTRNIIWRLGGKKNDFTFINDPIGFSHQHSISRLENGNILLFDNGNLHVSQVSTSIIYDLDEINMTATLIKRYGRTPEVYSNHGAGTQEVHNGNIINHWGTYWPSFTEFHKDGSIALDVDFTEHSFSPRINKFLWETKIFETDKDSLDFGQIENHEAVQSLVTIKNNKTTNLVLTGFSSHSNLFEISANFPITIAAGASLAINVQFNSNNADKGVFEDVLTLFSDTDTERIARQIWVFAEKLNNLTAISELDLRSVQFILSPVPVSNILDISTLSKDEKGFEIYSLSGQLVYQSPTFIENSMELNVSEFKDGIYLFVLTNKKTMLKQTKKLIIQK